MLIKFFISASTNKFYLHSSMCVKLVKGGVRCRALRVCGVIVVFIQPSDKLFRQTSQFAINQPVI